jgi:hypothetical protein
MFPAKAFSTLGRPLSAAVTSGPKAPEAAYQPGSATARIGPSASSAASANVYLPNIGSRPHRVLPNDQANEYQRPAGLLDGQRNRLSGKTGKHMGPTLGYLKQNRIGHPAVR